MPVFYIGLSLVFFTRVLCVSWIHAPNQTIFSFPFCGFFALSLQCFEAKGFNFNASLSLFCLVAGTLVSRLRQRRLVSAGGGPQCRLRLCLPVFSASRLFVPLAPERRPGHHTGHLSFRVTGRQKRPSLAQFHIPERKLFGQRGSWIHPSQSAVTGQSCREDGAGLPWWLEGTVFRISGLGPG